jgi:hypothetical protein
MRIIYPVFLGFIMLTTGTAYLDTRILSASSVLDSPVESNINLPELFATWRDDSGNYLDKPIKLKIINTGQNVLVTPDYDLPPLDNNSRYVIYPRIPQGANFTISTNLEDQNISKNIDINSISLVPILNQNVTGVIEMGQHINLNHVEIDNSGTFGYSLANQATGDYILNVTVKTKDLSIMAAYETRLQVLPIGTVQTSTTEGDAIPESVPIESKAADLTGSPVINSGVVDDTTPRGNGSDTGRPGGNGSDTGRPGGNGSDTGRTGGNGSDTGRPGGNGSDTGRTGGNGSDTNTGGNHSTAKLSIANGNGRDKTSDVTSSLSLDSDIQNCPEDSSLQCQSFVGSMCNDEDNCSTDKSYNEAADESDDKSNDESDDKSNDESDDKSNDESDDKSNDESDDKSNDESDDKSDNDIEYEK